MTPRCSIWAKPAFSTYPATKPSSCFHVRVLVVRAFLFGDVLISIVVILHFVVFFRGFLFFFFLVFFVGSRRVM